MGENRKNHLGGNINKYSLSDSTLLCVVDHDSDLRANVQVLPPNGNSSSSSTRAFPRLHGQQLWDLNTDER